MNLAKLAAFLGPTYAVHDDPDDEGTPYIIWEVAPSYWHGRFKSDADLFYALLVRAAERGLAVCTESVEKSWHTALYSEATGMISVVGPTPLDALVKAIEELPQGEPV